MYPGERARGAGVADKAFNLDDRERISNVIPKTAEGLQAASCDLYQTLAEQRELLTRLNGVLEEAGLLQSVPTSTGKAETSFDNDPPAHRMSVRIAECARAVRFHNSAIMELIQRIDR